MILETVVKIVAPAGRSMPVKEILSSIIMDIVVRIVLHFI